jgi:hypothetical protein
MHRVIDTASENEKLHMKKCQAFSALVGSRDAWRPCSRRAVPGSAFCGRHTEVAAGIMLGLCVHGFLEGLDTAPQPKRDEKRLGSASQASASPQRIN